MFSKKVFQIITCLCVGVAVGWLSPMSACSEEPGEKTIKLESGLYYTVQTGDTLWDLSEHFYDFPWLWPDLWERNREVANPHWIYPGEQVRIYSREELERMFGPKPPPEPKIGPPPPEPEYYYYPAIDSVGFIRKEPVPPSGTIFKVKEDKEIMSQRDVVYVRPIGDVIFKPGDRFTVFRTLKPLKDKETKKLIGTQHYLVGVVEITDVQPKFSLGRIVTSYRSIERDDLLMPYQPRSPNILLTESKEGLQGKIFSAEEGQAIFAEHAIAFINKGREDGIQVGQSYSVYYQEKERIDPKVKEDVLLTPVDYAKILILLTEETTATALVIYSEKSIEPGATIHATLP
ncbi:MAG: LysM peptidoglycan-binding domain-containing protein [Desulfobacterales bacterium]|nr:MAG: LysM peptidoglycan-binding domain-containing protein [Desulfobacterales bacterium]